MRSYWTKRITLTLAIMLPVVACEDDEPTGPNDGMATLSVFLTDAPGDVDSVWVQLLSVTAKGGDGGPVELLSESTDLILLTDLVGTVQLLTVINDFDPTKINQLRLVVGDAVLKSSEDGVNVYVKGHPDLTVLWDPVPEEVGELHCPSCSQSGIKVKVPNDEMEIGKGEAALVLDFDVAQSFGHKAGNSGRWVMHPVIHGTLVDELSLVSSVTGTVATNVTVPNCPAANPRSIQDFIPTATVNGLLDGEGLPLVWSGTVEANGTFQVGFLPSASYTMGFVATLTLESDQLVFTAEVEPPQVTVSGADVTGVAYTILSADCLPIG